MTIDLSTPEEFSYDQQIYMLHPRVEGRYCQRDRHTLTRVPD